MRTSHHTFEPVEPWPRLPHSVQITEAVGVATDSRDFVYVFNRGDPPVLVFDPEGHRAVDLIEQRLNRNPKR